MSAPFTSTLRRLLGSATATLVVGLFAGSAASDEGSPCTGEPVTCNDDRSLCCNWWIADVLVDGQKTGAVLEDSYEKLQRSLASHRKTDASLCAYFRDRSDCASNYGAPRCSGTVSGAVKQVGAGVAVPFTQTFTSGGEKLAELAEAKAAFQTFLAARSFDTSTAKGASTTKAATTAVGDRIRAALLGSREALDEYARNLEGAIGRAKNLRTQLSQCARSVNPFLELDKPSDPGDLPRVWQSTINFGYGYAPTFQFAAPSQQHAQQIAGAEGRGALDGLLRRAPRIPRLEKLHLDGPSTVTRIKGSGAGRLLFGDQGTLRPKVVLPAGDYPLLFAGDSGGKVAFSAASVSHDLQGPTDRVTISGASGSAAETIELTACLEGSELKKDTCVCSGSTQWSNGRCECPAGKHLAGGTCQACPATTTWNGRSCECPPDTHLISGACRTCGGGSVWNGLSCACPTGLHPERGVCMSCPSGTTWNSRVCACPTGMTWNVSQCVGSGVQNQKADPLLLWSAANAFCRNQRMRLPTLDEALALLRAGVLQHPENMGYWTSTPSSEFPDNVMTTTGNTPAVDNESVSRKYWVRCVP